MAAIRAGWTPTRAVHGDLIVSGCWTGFPCIGPPGRRKWLEQLCFSRPTKRATSPEARSLSTADTWLSSTVIEPSSTLLVTGGMGFVMSNLARHWLESYPDADCVVVDTTRPDLLTD